MTIFGYQGVSGSYSECAILKFSNYSKDIQSLGFAKFEDIFKALRNNEISYGFIPIENTTGGSIHINYDLLLEYSDMKIIYEYIHKVEHNLLVHPDSNYDNIEIVKSHPQALAQVKNFLKDNNFKSESVYDTAGMAKYITENNILNIAAIASIRAAHVYNLKILKSNIEDNSNNYTRFLVISNNRFFISILFDGDR